MGCKCNEGYWNETTLNNFSSCKPCNETCKSCSNAELCESCIDHDAVNIEGRCIIFCNKSRTSNCIKIEDILIEQNIECELKTDHFANRLISRRT